MTQQHELDRDRVERFGVRCTYAELVRVRDLVREHRNRTLKGHASVSRSMTDLAEELAMRPAQVEAAMRYWGFHTAADDARAKDPQRPVAPQFRRPGTRPTPTTRTKFNPHGWTE
jgi:hypothetical protein